jgi:hypothetical protein
MAVVGVIFGGYPYVSEVLKIDTLREWAVSSQPPMHAAKFGHAAVYHSQYLYVLGGHYGRDLSECESYVFVESRWEVLSPVACYVISAVEYSIMDLQDRPKHSPHRASSSVFGAFTPPPPIQLAPSP